MSPGARKHWKRLAHTLERAGIISQIDGLSLRLLAESIELYETAVTKLAPNTLVLKTTNGNLMMNPFLAIRNRAWEQIVKLAGSFGLTPADRNGMSFSFVNASGPSGAKDKSRFFGGPPSLSYGRKPS
jgi:P27 family predicted phage terminase small subunit